MGAAVHQLPDPPKGRFKDFDEAEKSEEPISVRVKGRDYVLPNDAPLAPVLKSIRNGGDLSDKEAFEFLEKALGPDNLNQMAEDGLGIKQFTKLARWALAEYGLSGGGDDSNPPA